MSSNPALYLLLKRRHVPSRRHAPPVIPVLSLPPCLGSAGEVLLFSALEEAELAAAELMRDTTGYPEASELLVLEARLVATVTAGEAPPRPTVRATDSTTWRELKPTAR